MVPRRSPRCRIHFAAGFLIGVFLQGGNNVSVVAFTRPSSAVFHRRRQTATSNRVAVMAMPSRTNTIGVRPTTSTPPTQAARIPPRWGLLAKSDAEDEEEDLGTAPGMKDAFRQLDALASIGNDSSSSSSTRKTPSSSSKSPIQPPATTPMADTAPPEKQIQVYTEMVKELEQQDQDDLYSDVLADMGADPSTMMSAASSKSKPSSFFDDDDDDDSVTSLSESDTEKFMNQALQEALQEAAATAAKDKASGGGKTTISESVLNDKEIMKEIEQIFERGNAQLFESIEEMRTEQRELAKASAEDTAQSAMDNIDVNAQRLASAESSMVAMLERVNKETAAVEKAVQDLQQAQMDMANKGAGGAAGKLRQGGIPKQAALVGLVLFSFRSIADSIAVMGSSGGDGDMTAALIQGAIALACGVYLILF